MKEDTDVSSGRRGSGCRKPGVRGCLSGLVVFFVLGSIGWYVLMGRAAAPANSSFEIQLDRMRQLATEGPGGLPVRLNAVVVGEGSYPQVLVRAGAGLQPRRMVFAAYQLVYEDRSLVIDSTLPEESYEKMFPGAPFGAREYESIQEALLKSSLVLLTHSHTDHIEGITRSPNALTLLPKVLFTPEQLADTSPDVGMTPELLEQVQPTSYEQYYSPMPGVVLMKAPGHSSGDQLIYIQLQNGREFLLTGDVVWSNENITRATGRPLLFRWLVREDWEKNGNEIRALHDLAENEPIHMLVSHDGLQLEEYIRQGWIGDGFE